MAIARKQVGITKLKKEAAEIVRRVHEDNEEFVITVDGKIVARLSPYSEEMSGDEFNRAARGAHGERPEGLASRPVDERIDAREQDSPAQTLHAAADAVYERHSSAPLRHA